MDLDNWPDCPTVGCTNKICLALDSQFCFPHTPGNKYVKSINIDVRRVMREKKKEINMRAYNV